ncbi:zinc finger protein 1 [Echinococcus multilocularis]|uniref:Zinc finger protein 1 n=1 Tax=Echinococcus multilocularis TaxID=6211 RepID=A0A087VZB2_ECHMU|nr:zinc finger protein 1 [Echinococcus multilocularis]
MGLCKCKRKKVTNLFCFEHRVNVCEFCLIASHPKCVVKSYLNWLKDSDYLSQCSLCSKELDNGEECIRLLCLDIFHWRCLDNYASQLPATTAPAGYECPSCSMCIIPLTNQGGPVAEALRQKILSSKWAKPNRQGKASVPKSKAAVQPRSNETLAVFDDSKLLDTSVDTYASQFLRDQEMVTPPTMLSPKLAETVVPIECPLIDTSKSRFEYKGNCLDDPKQPLQKFANPRNLVIDDEDADKYRRRPFPPFNSNGRLLGLTRCIPSAAPRLSYRRRLLYIFGLVIFTCFATILITNLLAAFPPPEDTLVPARPHPPVGV